MIRKWLFLVVLILLMPSFAFATATVASGGNFVQITVIDADWLWTDTFGATNTGIYIEWIAFKPGAASDKLSVKEGSDTGVEIFPSVPRTDANTGQIIYYGGKLIRPMIDYSDCTLNAGHQVTIMMAQ